MNQFFFHLSLAAWIGLIAVLFRRLKSQQALLIGLFGGYLFLPRGGSQLGLPFLTLEKQTTIGLALLLSALLWDRARLRRFRPVWADLPMLLLALVPLASLVDNHFEDPPDAIRQLQSHVLWWAVPYLIGRLYFGAGDQLKALATAIVVAGLLYIPVCVYEMIVGPPLFLARLMYGQADAGNAWRLGGWRPEGFMINGGLELCTWMAMTAVMACWLWLQDRHGRVGRLPVWMALLALLTITMLCRGVYGYAILLTGLAAVLLSRWLGIRLLLIGLLLVPPL